MAAGRCDLDPVSAALPRPPRDSAMEPMLKRSNMKQPQRRYCLRSYHMPQEPLKLFQWDRGPALERIQAVQHRLSTFLREACCLIDRIQFHTEKRDPLRRGEFALFPVDPKAQLAEVRVHQVPVFAQLVLRLWQYEPVIEVVENANALFSQGNKGCLHNFRDDTGRQGQPEGQDLVLICPSFKHKLQEWPVVQKD